MSHPLVVNVRASDYDVYIGRDSRYGDPKWGNPFKLSDYSRSEAIEKYREYILKSPLMDDLHELRGKRLGCHCAPSDCHGDVLAQLANSLQTKRILVCGPRDFDMPLFVFGVVAGLKRKYGSDITIIHGVARGVDSLAGLAAKKLGLAVEEFPADWQRYKRAAGPIRNQQMIDEGKPDLCVSIGQGRGTNDMVAKARNNGLLVIRRYVDADFS